MELNRMISNLPHILVIVGPTASGKSTLALSIAQQIPSEIVSADSRQIYKHLSIGTAKPSEKELKSVPHHFIDRCEPNERFTAGDFQREGRKIISEILSRNKLPIIVGGTGLYIRGLIDGFFEQPEFTKGIRLQLHERLKHEGVEVLHKELENIDPLSAKKIPSSRYSLVIRALEVYYETGIPISQFHAEQTKDEFYDAQWIGLNWERSELYNRINARVDAMIVNGFLDEVKNLKSLGFDEHLQSLQTVGYKEGFAYLRGEITLERMIELMKQNTRHFAKRQVTWFRTEERILWHSISNESEIKEIAKSIALKFQK
jgi:tRNA dimethylallyltransferase